MVDWATMFNWAQAGPSMAAAFFASLVEFVEALTIVLAVGTVRGWKPALLGTLAGLALLVLIVLVLGPLLDAIPLTALQLAIGVLLLLFGMRWLRKAILRSAGIIALHDELATFDAETQSLRDEAGIRIAGWDAIAVATTFKGVVLEGLEVVFIVIAVGAAGDTLVAAGVGAAAAFVLVVGLGLVLHRPLARVPENALKFGVGVLISAFGVFWIGEGLGLEWPGADWSLLVIAGALLATALAAVPLARRHAMPVVVE